MPSVTRLSGDERDALEVRRVDALEALVVELERGGHERRARERTERSDELHRTFSAVGGLPSSWFFAGEDGLRRLMRIPAFAAMWKGVVPPENLSAVCDAQTRQEWPLVRCRCGSSTSLERFYPRECIGDCGRSFLALEQTVRFSMGASQVAAA